VGYLLAVALFLAAATERRVEPTVQRISVPKALVGYALAVTLGAAYIVNSTRSNPSYPYWTLVLAAWGVGLAAYVLAWITPDAIGRSIQRFWSERRVEVIALSCILLVGLVLRVVGLDQFPRAFGPDEAGASLFARRVLAGAPAAPFGQTSFGLGGYPSLYFYGQSLGMRLLGDDVAGARLFTALLGTGTIAALYLLGRQLFGSTVGLVAAAMLAAFPYHLLWSRIALQNAADSLTMICVVLFWTRGLASGRPLDFALVGVSLGLGQLAYSGTRLLLALVPLLVLREVIADRGWLRRNLGNLFVLAGGLVVAYLPQHVHYVNHPDEYWGRMRQVSIISSGWLMAEADRRGSVLAVLWEQFRATFLVFHAVPPRTWFESGRPLLDPASGLLMAFGLALAVAQIRQRNAFALLVGLVLSLTGVALTEHAPAGTRLGAALPLALVLVALGLHGTATIVANRRPRFVAALCAGYALAMAAFGTHFFFLEYANQAIYDHLEGNVLTELGHYMRQFPPGTRLVVLDHGKVACNNRRSTLEFIAPQWPCVDVPEGGGASVRPELRPTDVVATMAPRRAEAERLLAGRPPASIEEIHFRGRVESGTLVIFKPEGSSG
jgi:4-amino-4-deoxy-L-arabinose transferase-like glycosyltransferase